METKFTFRNLEPTDGLKDHTVQKMTKVKKYLLKPITVNVIFSLDKFRQRCEITVIDSGTEYIGSETTTDMYQSIDRSVEKIVRQLQKHKERIKGHRVTPGQDL